MPEAVIIDAVRTPIGNFRGSLASIRADDLAAISLKAIIERTGIDPALVEEVYLGCANQAGEDNRNVARMATLLADFPVEVAALTINRLCASGLNAVNQAARAIKVGEGEIFIAGGVENMTRGPFVVGKPEIGYPYGSKTMWDTAFGWRFPHPKIEEFYGTEAMGVTAENLQEFGFISREEQDAFSLRSHQRAVAAMDDGRFDEEICPVSVPQRKKDPVIFDSDERPRRDTTMEKLAKLRPAFKKEGGTVTAGNASGLNDGSAAVLVMSDAKAKELGLKPMARIVTSAAAGVAPRTMGMGPVPATRKALERAGLKLDDIGLIELNEAFAVQSLAVMRELDMNPDIVNVNGGAIALGHPLGCSGTRILTTLLHEMKRRAPQEKKPYYGLATLCVGVGQGEATIVEWVE
ncbi:MAG: acetyl-CoA C-acetyltransferase [Anaerolineae bacterium]|jgi:3-oxoadipyl-CoA thiolase|nr:acetyl-CoA C-acetyltransferase [Anaerolineae bacterium]MBT7190104.1 acetyl-CoA C-acetyltransferase [Anaerolineae bacterium]MBT7990706.1 acetyl-CoA C-acetyltransferase [Anaerolineae bacterium]